MANPPLTADTEAGKRVRQLRLSFLLPLTSVIFVAVFTWILTAYLHERNSISQEVGRLQAALRDVQNEDARHDLSMLAAVDKALSRDDQLRKAFARKDRGALLARTAPLFAELRRTHDITHFYFTAPDHVNLLRVHQPDRYGDVIDRFTTREAARTGKPAYGLELGPMGTLTLRLVTPWHEAGGRLIGYVELGIEMDHLLKVVRNFLGPQVFVLISKQYLKRETWEAGMRMLNRAPAWERFPDVVLSVQSVQDIPLLLSRRLSTGPLQGLEQGMAMPLDGADYRAAFLPLRDAEGRSVGQLVALVDVSGQVRTARHAMLAASVIGLAAAGFLFGLFWWLVGRIGAQLERHERTLKELATHDGLTGLYNHRTFYQMLEDETLRSRRYGASVALLLLDIDHFKHVNDTWGHVAGDTVLQALSRAITREAREIDKVCRYGGEEITLILPQTGSDNAMLVAERIRAEVENHRFAIEPDQEITITVSIGVAAFPEHGSSAREIVTAADQALYAAKQQGRNRVCRHGRPG